MIKNMKINANIQQKDKENDEYQGAISENI